MERSENLNADVRLVPSLEVAIDNWLVALAAYVMKRSDKTEYDYNAAYFELGEAFNEPEPEAGDTPGGFERYRHSLIAPEKE